MYPLHHTSEGSDEALAKPYAARSGKHRSISRIARILWSFITIASHFTCSTKTTAVSPLIHLSIPYLSKTLKWCSSLKKLYINEDFKPFNLGVFSSKVIKVRIVEKTRSASFSMKNVKGTTNPKNYQFLNFFLFLTKCEHVADVVVNFYSCATCVKEV